MFEVMLGIATWMSTGVDDLLVILTLLSICQPRSRAAIVAGTLVGTMLMFGLSTLIAHLVGPIFGESTNAVGLVPIVVGVMVLRNLPSPDDESRKTNGPVKMFLMSLGFYLMNMTDDVSVNTSLLIHMTGSTKSILLLGVGNIIGASLALAGMHWFTILLRKHLRVVAIFGATAIICFGVVILLGGGACMADVMHSAG
ncbi:hypothetical protein KKC88_00670 [Patescibacteria group bacterium]|nr:hypothetical protein [Patescibacteria group bacterium]MBU1673774.1 hypothetical protein [Patescibacteria group bacterium]MBU1964114.1 hypothetical protein [Patescibacteria group bacterium]